jgi:hypothetical protein
LRRRRMGQLLSIVWVHSAYAHAVRSCKPTNCNDAHRIERVRFRPSKTVHSNPQTPFTETGTA